MYKIKMKDVKIDDNNNNFEEEKEELGIEFTE